MSFLVQSKLILVSEEKAVLSRQELIVVFCRVNDHVAACAEENIEALSFIVQTHNLQTLTRSFSFMFTIISLQKP